MIKNDTSLNASHTRIYEGPNEESISFIDDKTAGKSPETFSEDQIEKNCSSTMEKKQISGFSESEQKPNFRNQYLATLVVNVPIVASCVSNSWASAANILLKSDDTPLPSGKISIDEASWIASLFYLGGLIGTFSFGYLTKRFGRKWLLISVSSVAIVSWLLVYFAQNVYYLYASRVFNGFYAGSAHVMAPVFLVEIASDVVRGKIVSSTGVATCTGILLGFFLGSFGFYVTPIFVIAITILFAVVFTLFPESPACLLQQNKITEMERSIRFYQNVKSAKSMIANSDTDKNQHSLKWSDISSNPGRKAMIISVFLICLCSLCGISAIMNYSAQIFEETGSTVSPNTSSVVTGIILIIGSLTTNRVVDCTGRKILYVLSSLGVALGFVVLGGFMLLKSWNYSVDAFNWIPLISMSFSIFTSSLALITMPIAIASEVLPKTLKEFGIAVCMVLTYLLIFAMTKLLPFFMYELHLYGCLFLFASFCLFGAMWIIIYMPETKGKTYEQIMQSLQ